MKTFTSYWQNSIKLRSRKTEKNERIFLSLMKKREVYKKILKKESIEKVQFPEKFQPFMGCIFVSFKKQTATIENIFGKKTKRRLLISIEFFKKACTERM